MGGAYIAHFAMYATVEDRTCGKKRPCVRHPDYLYTYFVDTTLGWHDTVVGPRICRSSRLRGEVQRCICESWGAQQAAVTLSGIAHACCASKPG
jgi:hypothetical protein